MNEVLEQDNFIVYFQSQLMRVYSTMHISELEHHVRSQHFTRNNDDHLKWLKVWEDGKLNIYVENRILNSADTFTCDIVSILENTSDVVMNLHDQYKKHGHILKPVKVPMQCQSLNGNLMFIDPCRFFTTLDFFIQKIKDQFVLQTGNIGSKFFEHMFIDVHVYTALRNFECLMSVMLNNQ